MDNHFTVIYDGEYSVIESEWVDEDIKATHEICATFPTMEEAAAYIDEQLNMNN